MDRLPVILADFDDPGLNEILKLLRDARLELQEANEAPMAIDTCDCLACKSCVEPSIKGQCQFEDKGWDCVIDPNQPSANRHRG